MTTPTPPDAARSYSDDEIDEELARLVTHRHFGAPRDIIEELPAHSPIILAIIRQLRAERAAARAEVEKKKRAIQSLKEVVERHRKFLKSIHMWPDDVDEEVTNEPTGGRESEDS